MLLCVNTWLPSEFYHSLNEKVHFQKLKILHFFQKNDYLYRILKSTVAPFKFYDINVIKFRIGQCCSIDLGNKNSLFYK